MARTVNHARREQKKSEIIIAAMQCFAEKGFHSTSMQDVCRAISMSPGSLYRYFSSKDEIIIAIVEEERRQDDEFARQISNGGSLFGALEKLISHVIQQSNEPGYTQLSAEIYAEINRNEKATAIASEAHTLAADAVAFAINKAIENEEIDSTWDPEALAEVLIVLIDSLDTRPMFTKKASDKAIHKTVIKLIGSIRN